jgi:predicted small lipoprotein YifL
MKKLLTLTLLTLFTLTSCGRNGQLEYPEGQKRPKFDKVIDEKN